MHSFEVHSNESACRKSGRLGLEQVLYTIYYIVYTIYYILFSINYILYTVYDILYTKYYVLYTICLLWFRSPWPDSMLIIGWCWFQSPNSGYPVTRLCPLLVSLLLFPSTGGYGPPPLFPHPIVPQSSLSTANSPACVSLSSFLLSVRVSLSAVRLYDWLGCSRCQSQRPNVCLRASLTCAAGGTWLRCGCRGVGDGAPRDGLDFLDASTGVVWRVGFSRSPVEEGMSYDDGMC